MAGACPATVGGGEGFGRRVNDKTSQYMASKFLLEKSMASNLHRISLVRTIKSSEAFDVTPHL
jgi:hypothetical protein